MTSGGAIAVPPDTLAPYVPQLVIDWLRDTPHLRHRGIDGTLVFADVSGFTQLTERLARRGKVGAEEIGDIINAAFEQLLAAAYDYGAGLVKWGGDAVLLLFTSDRHAERAARAAVSMQAVMRRIGRVTTSAGTVRLGISLGVHSARFDVYLVGERHRELLVCGADVDRLVALEAAAAAGQTLVSDATAALLRQSTPRGLVAVAEDRWMLTAAPDAALEPNRSRDLTGAGDLRAVLPRMVREHVENGPSDGEHRGAAVGFIVVSGVGAAGDATAVSAALDAVLATVQRTVDEQQVALLATDLAADGLKVVLCAGAPRRTGDDEARLLAAMTTIVGTAAPLTLRGGVTSGRVFAGDFGPFYRRTYSITGDVVNLAARLAGAAAPGEVLATREALDASRTRFAMTGSSLLALKGKTEPVQAYSVHGAMTEAAGAIAETLPLIGRDREVGLLLDAWMDARRGAGRVVVLSADAGMGKSRLVEEGVERIRPHAAAVVAAHGDVYAGSTPYLPFQRLLRGVLGLKERSLLDAVTATAPSLLAWLPLLGTAAGVETAMTPEVAAIPASLRPQRLARAVVDVLDAALRGATVILLDDLYLMDDASLGLVRTLTAEAATRPWLVLVTSRKGQVPIDEAAHVTTLELAPLADADADRLLALATGTQDLARHRVAAARRRAAGNPLFLRALAAAAADEDVETLPDSIDGVIGARIDRLVPADRRLLRTAAVLGMEVDTEVLAGVAAADETTSLDVSRLSDFLRDTGEGRLVFAHHMVRQVAYEGLPYRRRALLHGRAADVIEASLGDTAVESASELLSLHFFHAERYHAAWRYSRIAAERARAAYAFSDAIEFYERAVASAQHVDGIEPASVSAVHEALGDSRYELGEFARADSSYRAARRLAPTPVDLAGLRLKTALIRERNGDWTGALRWMSRGRVAARREAGTAEADRMLARIDARAARALHMLGRPHAAIRRARRARDAATACGEREALARALTVIDWADFALGNLHEVPNAHQALAIFVEIGDLVGQAKTLNDLGIRAFYTGDWPEALRWYAESEAAFERAGTSWDAALSSANIAEILVYQGRGDEARPRLDAGMRVWRAAQALPEQAFGDCQLARIDILDGRWDAALERLAAARDYFASRDQPLEVVYVDSLRAEALLLRGDVATALDVTGAALAQLAELGESAASVASLRRIRGLALARGGDRASARDELERSLASARGRGARHEIAFTLDAMLSADLLPADLDAATAEAERDELIERLGVVARGTLTAQ